MIARRTPRPTGAKNLEQQQADFTSEGSPPPGKVATDVPVTKEAKPGFPSARRPPSPRRRRSGAEA